MADFLTVFFSTTIIMLLAEFGDKTNLLEISLIGKYKKPKTVFFGGMVGITLVTIIGAGLGEAISNLIPLWIISMISGLVFLYLGISGLRAEHEDKVEFGNDNNILSSREIFQKSLILIGIAEFGDKSQIFVITTAALENPIPVALGAITGMAIIFALAAIIGKTLITRLPEEKINNIASYMFIIAGLWILGDTLLEQFQ